MLSYIAARFSTPPRLFDRFYQVDDSSTRKREGAGIGLALAHQIVELHGGTMKVESEVGIGSTFTVWLQPAEVAEIVGGDSAAVSVEAAVTVSPTIRPPTNKATEATPEPEGLYH